jgi:leader peptidase (prepilin peptidase) / N-methyltransferase
MLLYLIALIYGVIIGNYTTTAFYRIPHSIPINGLNEKIGKPPFCSQCGHKLKIYEYYPVLSWIFTRFKCNYCHKPVDLTYFVIELLVMITAIILYKLLDMTPIFVFSVLFAASLVLNILLYQRFKKFYIKSLLMLIFFTITITLTI